MTPDHLRASDADREQLARLLGQQLAAGRLTLVEFDDRVAAAYAATTVHELDGLLRDLPVNRDQRTLVARDGSRGPVRHDPFQAHGNWKAWWRVAALCGVIWLVTSVAHGGPLYFWPIWVFGPWGVALLAKALTGGRTRAGARLPG